MIGFYDVNVGPSSTDLQTTVKSFSPVAFWLLEEGGSSIIALDEIQNSHPLSAKEIGQSPGRFQFSTGVLFSPSLRSHLVAGYSSQLAPSSVSLGLAAKFSGSLGASEFVAASHLNRASWEGYEIFVALDGNWKALVGTGTGTWAKSIL